MRWHSAPSTIHGKGAFASEPIRSGEFVDYLVTGIVGLNAGGLLGVKRTSLGEHLNHQSNPTGRMERVPSKPDHYYFKALSNIRPGTELTMNYNDAPSFVARPHEVDPINYETWG